MRTPSLLWVPVEVSYWDGPAELIIHKEFQKIEKRAVGLVILIISAILATIAGMATGITSLDQEGLTAQSLNSLSEVTAQAFVTQATINQ